MGLFHYLWGRASEGTYDKKAWKQMQELLEALVPRSMGNRPFNVLYKGWWVLATNGPAITSSPTREKAAVYQGPADEEFWFKAGEPVEFVPLGEEPGGAFSASRARRDSESAPAPAPQPAQEPAKLPQRVLTALDHAGAVFIALELSEPKDWPKMRQDIAAANQRINDILNEKPEAADAGGPNPMELLGRVLTVLAPFQSEIRTIIHEATKHAR